MLSLSVIIPALNESQNIRRAVQSAWRTGANEVIVVDGGSRDDTQSISASCASRVLSSQAGRATQQNAGATESTGDVLLFQHADCQLHGECATQIRTWLESPSCIYGAFQQRIDAPGWKYGLVQRGNAARVRWLGLAYGDQAIFVRRRAFERVGGFPSVPIMEDVGLMRKLRRFGRPGLLPGPVAVNARRWEQNGVVAQTARNWCLVTAFYLGVSPQQLARFYPRHDPTTRGAGHQPDSRIGSTSGTRP